MIYYIDRTGGIPFHPAAIGGGIELPGQGAGGGVDVGLHQQPVRGVILELKVHQRDKNGGVQAGQAGIDAISGHFLVVIDAIGVSMALDNRITGEERGPEKGSADLTHAAPNAFDGLVTDDNERLGVTVVQGNITQA